MKDYFTLNAKDMQKLQAHGGEAILLIEVIYQLKDLRQLIENLGEHK